MRIQMRMGMERGRGREGERLSEELLWAGEQIECEKWQAPDELKAHKDGGEREGGEGDSWLQRLLVAWQMSRVSLTHSLCLSLRLHHQHNQRAPLAFCVVNCWVLSPSAATATATATTHTHTHTYLHSLILHFPLYLSLSLWSSSDCWLLPRCLPTSVCLYLSGCLLLASLAPTCHSPLPSALHSSRYIPLNVCLPCVNEVVGHPDEMLAKIFLQLAKDT